MGERATTPQSGIIVPVPTATPLVRQQRLRYDPAAAANVPEHVTVLYPFLAPDKIDADTLAALRSVFGATSPFRFTLRRTAWFGQGVLYLAPEPAAPFVALTQRLSQAFALLPYGGQYAEVIPHLTIAEHGPMDALTRIAADVAGKLPVDAVAREAWVMVGHNETGWVVRDRFTFGLT